MDFKAIGLGDYAPTEKYFERQTARWSQQYLSSKTKEIPSMNKLIEYLPKNVPKENEGKTLCILFYTTIWGLKKNDRRQDLHLHPLLLQTKKPMQTSVINYGVERSIIELRRSNIVVP